MKRFDAKLALSVVFLVAALAFLAVVTSHPSPMDYSGGPFAAVPADRQQSAPDFTLHTADGRTVRLSDAVKSGPVVLDFWATWCMPCRMELPDLEDVYNSYKGRGVQFYGVNSDASASEISQFAQANSLTFPMLVDSNQVAAQGFQASSIPLTVVVDKNMRIVAASVGFDPNCKTDLSHRLDALLRS